MGIYFVLGMVILAAVFVLTALHFDDKRDKELASYAN